MKKLLTFLTLLVLAFGVGWAATATDVLTRATTGVTSGSSSYSDWSGKTSNSDAVYAGNSAGGNDAIQIRSKNSNSGIVSTSSGGTVKSVTVSWESHTVNGRTINIYGKNSAYSSPSDLYNSSSQGTLLGTIVKGTSTSLTISGSYAYIGIRSSSDPLYLSEVDIVWETSGGGGGPTAPSGTVTISPSSGAVTSGTEVTLSFSGTCDGIKYTTNGDTPDATHGSLYDSSNKPTITSAMTLKAKAYNVSNGSYAFGTEASATYTISGGGGSSDTEYVLVENASGLVAGCEYLIANANGSVLMGAMNATGNTYATQVTTGFETSSDHKTITVHSSCSATPITLGGSSGAWTLHNGSGYIAYTNETTSETGNNYLMLVSNPTAYGATWTISNFPSSQTLIVNADNTVRSIRYNSGSSRFAGYGTGQAAVALYKKAGAYSVTVDNNLTGGSVSVSPTSGDGNETITVTVTPDTGYVIGTVTYSYGDNDYTITPNNGVYSFTMPEADVTVSATFNRTYTVTVTQPAAGGTVSVSPSEPQIAGTTITLTATTSTGYQFGSWDVTRDDTNAAVNVSNNQFSMPSSNVTVTATFTKIDYTITKRSMTNGDVTVASTANYGDVVTITPQPNSGYKVDKVYYNDGSDHEIALNNGTYSFSMPAGNVTVWATFDAIPAFSVTVTQPAAGGEISASPVGENVVAVGDKITVTATSYAGYELSSWTITGAQENAPDTNNQITATGNVTITATFSKIQYSITNVGKTNGEDGWTGGSNANFSGVSTVDGVWGAQVGDQVSFNANTNQGYQILQSNISIKDASDNDVSFTFNASNGNLVTFTMPASNVTITANYTYYRPTVKLAGHFNGNSTWRTSADACPSFSYDSTNDKYTLTAFFTGLDDGGANDFFFLLLDGAAKHPQADQGNYYIYELDGDPMPFNLSGGDNNNFGVAPGVYDIEINGGLNSMKFTKRDYSLTFSPASGSSVETGTTVSASCAQLVTDIAAIDSNASVTVGVNTDNGSTWNASETLSTVGSATIYGKAYIGNIAVTGTATYTVTRPVVISSLFHETFGDNSSNARNWDNSYSVKSGVAVVYSGITGYEVTNCKQSKNTVGFVASALISTTVSNVGQTASIVIGPLSVADYESLKLSYYWKASALSGTYWTKASFATSASGVYTELTETTGTAAAATSYVLREYSLPSSAEVSTLYIKIEWLTSNTNGYIDEVDLQGALKYVEPGEYTITYATVTGGTLGGPADADEDDVITVTATPTSGYACTGISVSPSAAVTDNHDGTYTFTMPASDVTVTPTWAQAIAITYVNQYYDNNGNLQTGNTGGTVTGPASAVDEDPVYVTYTPAEGYQLKSLEYAWATGHSEVSAINSNPFFLMPGTPTTVTAVFEKKPYNITVVSEHGQVTGISATAVSGQTVSFTITPVAGYTITNVFLEYENNDETVQTVLTPSDGTYSFSMLAKDVTIRVGYFAGDEYELLTDLSEINENDTYLIVGGAASDAPAPAHVMSATFNKDKFDVVELNTSNYEVPDGATTGIIKSSSAMNIIKFVAGTDDNAGKWAVYSVPQHNYLYAASTGKMALSTTPYYGTITASDQGNNRVDIKVNNLYLKYNSTLFRFYTSSSTGGATYIYKLHDSNKVKKPTITGAAGQYIGLYNFIGTDQVTLACATEGATIEYKIGAGNWTTYSEPFALPQTALDGTVTVTARAKATGLDASDEVSATFTCIKPTWHTKPCGDNWNCTDVEMVNPVFIYPAGSLANRNAYGEENIHFFYTTDGSTPTTTPSAEITVSSGDKFLFVDSDIELSIIPVINGIAGDPVSGIITFEPAAPESTLAAGAYDGDKQTRLSTATVSKINNTDWTTRIYYAIEGTNLTTPEAFAFNPSTGEVTSSGWTLYNPSTAPYIDLLVANGELQTLHAVTLSNFYGGTFTGTTKNATVHLASTGTWVKSDESTFEYTLTAANLDVVFSPAGGAYLYTKHVTLTPQNVVGTLTMTYDITWAAPDGDDHKNATGVSYNGAITVDQDATITVHASDTRLGEGGSYTKSHTYKIGVQEPMFSPLPGDYYTGDAGDLTIEMFSVSPNAKIYYTSDGTEPSKTHGTLYSGDIALPAGTAAGTVVTYKAIAYVGGEASAVHTGTYTIRTKLSGNYWQNIKEMNEEKDHSTAKTLANPVEVVYMSTYQDNGTTPEFAFVRDNSGYGYIYFGKDATSKNSWKKYQPGDWIKGNTITGQAKTWSASYINELDMQSQSDNTAWNAGLLQNRPLVPEYTTCRAIREGWTGDQNFSGTDYKTYVDENKHLFGHYVHLRRNTMSGVSKDNNGKEAGTIVGEYGTQLYYYDGLYLYSGFGDSDDFDQTEFNKVQNKGGTYAVYGIVYFYGPNASKSSSYYQPYEIFPIDFEYIFPPIFHLAGDDSAADMTNHELERTIHEATTLTLTCDTRGAQIWYKTSDMEDFQIYEGESIAVNKSMTVETYSTHSTDKFDELQSITRILTINLGEVKQPVISPENQVLPIGATPVEVTITCESSGATIWYTTDDSDPSDETNTARQEYDKNTGAFTVSETTTVRAIAEEDGYYGMEAEPKTYTFVKSNGIVYDLVKNASDLDANSIYVIVNKKAHMAIQRTQKDNNRDGVGVAFVNDATKEQVLGNDDLAVFTIKGYGASGDWIMHTSNGSDNKSNGYIYGKKSSNTNQLLTQFNNAQNEGKFELEITIGANDSDVDKAYVATMSFVAADGGERWLRFNKQNGLFNTYSSTTGEPVFLYKKAAYPLANIEVTGVVNQSYTVADELVGVKAIGKMLWAKDQGDVSIIKTENTGEWRDYVAEMEAKQAGGHRGNWDQSNWVCLDFTNVAGVTENDVKELQGKLIPPATVTGEYVDNKNYCIAMADGSILDNAAGYTEVEYKPNVLCGANFNTAYLDQGEEGVVGAYGHKFWFLNPKVQEVVKIKYVVWDVASEQFIVPDKSDDGSVNGNNFAGAFGVSFGLNSGGVTKAEDLQTLDGEMFEFEAIVTRNNYDYGGNTSGAGGNGSGAPRRAGTASNSITVMPTNLGGGTITDVKDLPDAVKQVKAVRYIDITGRVSSKPFEGVNIIVTEYTDGSTSTRKVLK